MHDCTHCRNERDCRAADEGYTFDARLADHACSFMEGYLCLSKGQWGGKQFRLLDWQRDEIVRPLFGWLHPNGYRRFNRAYVEVPKKNGKSGLGSAVGLYLLAGDGEPGAEVYSCAVDKDQASIVHGEAIQMVNQSVALQRSLRVNRSTRTIYTLPSAECQYRSLSGEAASKEGLNIHGAIIDETHAWKGHTLWETIMYGCAARRQPIIFEITTAGIFDKQSLGWTHHEYASRILDGSVIAHNVLPYITCAADDDDWRDPAVWRKANPSLGYIITEDDLRASCQEAQDVPRLENSFRRYRLNQWTEQVDRWLPMDQWHACNANPRPFGRREVFAALDLSSVSDLTALVMVCPDTDGTYDVVCRFWVPELSASKRERRDGVPYLTWQRQGHITFTPGDVVDYRQVRADIVELSKTYQMRDLAYDPFNATQLATQLAEEDGLNMIQFRQGTVSMNEPSKILERLVRRGSLRHGGNPVLDWCASNVALDSDTVGNIKPSKKRSNEKIDGIVALIMALGRAGVHTQAAPSVYQSRGVRTL